MLEDMGWGVWRGDGAVAVVPALMLADYYLTILGARHFGRDEASRAAYEMNPLHRDAIGRLQLFNPRHLVLVAASTGLVVVSGFMEAWFYRLILGLCVGAFGYLVGRHLANIALMRLARTPHGRARGMTARSRGSLMEITAQQALAFAFAPLLLVAMLEPSVFLFGVVGGVAGIGLAPLHRLKTLDASARAEPVRFGQNACGFCGADAESAGKLIVGEGAVICDACVQTCAEALQDGAMPANAPA